MNQKYFHRAYTEAVDLHRRGETKNALSAVDCLLSAADNDEDRTACLNEKKNLVDHLALAEFFERGRKAQAAVLDAHKS